MGVKSLGEFPIYDVHYYDKNGFPVTHERFSREVFLIHEIPYAKFFATKNKNHVKAFYKSKKGKQKLIKLMKRPGGYTTCSSNRVYVGNTLKQIINNCRSERMGILDAKNLVTKINGKLIALKPLNCHLVVDIKRTKEMREK